MNIHYDLSSDLWFHEENSRITFGGEETALHKEKKTTQSVLTFPLKLINGHAGPLIGIIVGRKKNNAPAGNIRLFKKIQEELMKQKGLSFIFTPDGVREHSLEGLIYDPSTNAWFNVTAPFPDAVYNRIPFRSSEGSIHFQSIIKKLHEKKIPFFNPFFIDKYELYLLLNEHPILKDYLPETIPAIDQAKIQPFLSANGTIYLKTTKSSQGKGIYKLTDENGLITLYRGKFSETFENFSRFWENCGYMLQNKTFIAQKAILPQTYEGKRFDFRILAHADGIQYAITGIGVRQSSVQDITTHVPNGGKVVPYEKIRTPEHDAFIQLIVENAGKWLSSRWGFFGEFSIDAGISQTGKYYIYEINSKPMSFDEPEIENKKIQQLCKLFHQLSQFSEK